MKILIVRFSSIGDIVLTTPVVRAVKQQLNTTEIHFITKKSFASLLANNPHISKLYTIEKSVTEVLDELKAEKYDVVIDLHKNIRTLRLKQALGVKSYAFDKLNFQKWLLVNFKVDKLPNVHIVERYFEAVKEIGVVNDGKNCELFFDETAKVDTLKSFDLQPKSFVAVAVGAQFATKVMPEKLLIEVLKKVEHPIVLLGGPTDVDRARAIEIGLQQHSQKVINAVNQFSLAQSASIVAQSQVLLTHDTGLMHIATCYNTPIVSVWGNTVPAFGMYPYYPSNTELFSIHEVLNLNCRPCSKIGYESCPKKHFNCMNLQDVAGIAQAVNQRFDLC
ncbi:MAG TPA: glycosyltransferase family 9 protein [Taishania sp.]|nr:glycosyltransferase family 9 protein [Taishania sp.]HNS41316.1 glycosyltransferase family 9 protein [Taishania sp.]